MVPSRFMAATSTEEGGSFRVSACRLEELSRHHCTYCRVRPSSPKLLCKRETKLIDCKQCCGSGFNGVPGSNKDKKNFLMYFFSSSVLIQNPGSGLDQDPYPDSLEIMDPDPDPDSMNPDPQL